jgi:hypothetical protein
LITYRDQARDGLELLAERRRREHGVKRRRLTDGSRHTIGGLDRTPLDLGEPARVDRVVVRPNDPLERAALLEL